MPFIISRYVAYHVSLQAHLGIILPSYLASIFVHLKLNVTYSNDAEVEKTIVCAENLSF